MSNIIDISKPTTVGGGIRAAMARTETNELAIAQLRQAIGELANVVNLQAEVINSIAIDCGRTVEGIVKEIRERHEQLAAERAKAEAAKNAKPALVKAEEPTPQVEAPKVDA